MKNLPRFYKKKIPDIDEHIFCSVKYIDENCIYLHLLEYNKEVFIPFKDLNECRGRKAKLRINKKYKPNTNHIFYVTGVEDNIELSNRGIDEETLKEVTDSYNKKKLVINIFKDFLNNLKIDNEEDFIEYANKTIWKIEENRWYNKIIDIKIDNNLINIFDLNDEEKNLFIKYINHSINDIRYELNIDIQMFSIDIGGINTIKFSLDKINNLYNDFEREIKLLNAPDYKIIIRSNILDNLKDIQKFSELEKEFNENNNIVFCCKKKQISNSLNDEIITF